MSLLNFARALVIRLVKHAESSVSVSFDSSVMQVFKFIVIHHEGLATEFKFEVPVLGFGFYCDLLSLLCFSKETGTIHSEPEATTKFFRKCIFDVMPLARIIIDKQIQAEQAFALKNPGIPVEFIGEEFNEDELKLLCRILRMDVIFRSSDLFKFRCLAKSPRLCALSDEVLCDALALAGFRFISCYVEKCSDESAVPTYMELLEFPDVATAKFFDHGDKIKSMIANIPERPTIGCLENLRSSIMDLIFLGNRFQLSDRGCLLASHGTKKKLCDIARSGDDWVARVLEVLNSELGDGLADTLTLGELRSRLKHVQHYSTRPAYGFSKPSPEVVTYKLLATSEEIQLGTPFYFQA